MLNTRCPHCDMPLTRREQDAARCAACGKPLNVKKSRRAEPGELGSTQNPVIAEEIPSDSPGPAAPGGENRQAALAWGAARSGMSVVCFGALFLLIGFGGLWIAAKYAQRVDAADNQALLVTLRLLYEYSLLFGVMLILLGMFMSPAAPNRCGAKVVAFLTLLVGVGMITTHAIGYIGQNQNTVVEAENVMRRKVVEDNKTRITKLEEKPELAEPWKQSTLKGLHETARWLLASMVWLYVIFLFLVSLGFSASKTAFSLGLYFVLSVAGVLCILIERFREVFPSSEAFAGISWQNLAPSAVGALLALFGIIELLLVRGAIRRGVVRGEG